MAKSEYASTVKVYCPRIPTTREIEQKAPTQVMTHAGVIRFNDSHLEILQQIERTGEAFLAVEG